MDNTEDYTALLLAAAKTRKNLSDAVGLSTILIQEKILENPLRAFLSNDLQCFRNGLTVLVAYNKMRADVPTSVPIVNIQSEKALFMFVCFVCEIHQS